MRSLAIVLPIVTVLSAVACAPTADAPVVDQLDRGGLIYQQSCATTACHGTDGQGIPGGDDFRIWPLVGDDFQRRNPTAQVIFDVVRSGGEPSLRALTDQQLYDVIAYELSLNDAELSEPLNSQNAPFTLSGRTAAASNPATLFPPPGNASLTPTGSPPDLPAEAAGAALRMRLTQIALAASIGDVPAPVAGRYAIAVFTLEVLTEKTQEVGPQSLRLATEDGTMLVPLDIPLDFPVSRFRRQTIQPGHGTAAHAIFALPEDARIGRLVYHAPGEQPVVVELAP